MLGFNQSRVLGFRGLGCWFVGVLALGFIGLGFRVWGLGFIGSIVLVFWV